MPRKKNSGLGSFAFKPQAKQQSLSVAKVPTSFGQYPSKQVLGAARYPTVIEAWNRDSAWKRWRHGLVLSENSHLGWPLQTMRFQYQFNFNGNNETMLAKAFLFPSLEGDGKTWYTVARDDHSLDLSVLFDAVPTAATALGRKRNPKTGIVSEHYSLRFRFNSKITRLDPIHGIIGIKPLLEHLGTTRLINRYLKTDGSPADLWWSMQVLDVAPENPYLPTYADFTVCEMTLMEGQKPIGSFDPSDPAHMVRIQGERQLTLGRSYACSCPDYAGRIYFDLESTSDVSRAPVPTTETQAGLEERVGYFHSWRKDPGLSDNPKTFCKHIWSVMKHERHYVPEPNDMPTELNKEGLIALLEKEKMDLGEKLLHASSRSNALSSDSASFALARALNLPQQDRISGFNKRTFGQNLSMYFGNDTVEPTWTIDPAPPSNPVEGDVWEIAGHAFLKIYQGGQWKDLNLLQGFH